MKDKELIIRNEKPEDYAQVENLTREAFWNVYHLGCDEHFLAHKIREDESFVKELDFVVVRKNEIIANIMYSRSYVVDENEIKHQVITFGPVSVLPKYQKQGIGSKLIKYSIEKANSMNFDAIIIFGDPKFYTRFGFRPTKEFGIYTPDNKYFIAHQALELKKGALEKVHGKHFCSSVFELDQNEVSEFEKKFPYKDKHETESQKEFKKTFNMVEDI